MPKKFHRVTPFLDYFCIMKLKIYPLTAKNPLFARLLTLYTASFPSAERRPNDKLSMMTMDTTLPMKANAIKLDDEFVGLVNFWEFDDFLYIEHFAVSHHVRGLGLGSKVLNIIKSNYSKPVVLEIEMPESSPIAARRMDFYRRNGFRPIWDFKYVQPPYSPGLPQLRLLLMSTDNVDPQVVSDTLHSQVYGVSD